MASQRQLKSVWGVFSVCTLVFLFNLLHLQPVELIRASKRISFPGSGPIETSSIAHAASRSEPLIAPAAPATPRAATDREDRDLRQAVLRELAAKGYLGAGASETAEIVLKASIMAYEWDNRLPLRGEVNEPLLQSLVLGAAASGPAQSAAAAPGPEAEHVIRTVQRSLAVLGHSGLRADGRMGAETERAIRSFEARQSLPQTGRISGGLVERLIKLAGEGRLADRS